MGTGRSGSEKAALRRENQARLMDLLDWDSQTWDRWINALSEKAPSDREMAVFGRRVGPRLTRTGLWRQAVVDTGYSINR